MNILAKPIPSFPPREVLYDYILGRANKAGVKKYIRFNTNVYQCNLIMESEFEYYFYKIKKTKTLSKEKFDYRCCCFRSFFCSLHSGI